MEAKYQELVNEINLTNEDHPAIYTEWTKARALIAIANELAQLNKKLDEISSSGFLDVMTYKSEGSR